MTDVQFALPLANAVIAALAFVGAGVTAGLVIMVVWLGIRSGLRAMRDTAESAESWSDYQDRDDYLTRAYEADYAMSRDNGFSHEQAAGYAQGNVENHARWRAEDRA